MSTVHLVYPHGPRISAPDVIGRELGQRLKHHYRVVYHEWDDLSAVQPGPGDVLLGHPHPAPGTCFRRSLRQPGWRRVLALAPYHHGDPRQVAFLDSVIGRCDLYLAITGSFWFSSVSASPFAHWAPKMIHLDLAVNRRDFPVLKTRFSPPGQRRFVYIGHSGWTKNPTYLSQIARAMPETQIGWMGEARQPLPGLQPLGRQNFSSEASRQLLSAFDFMLTVGKADANPTTVLEAMAWGLIPVCTPQSGYVDRPGIVNIPTDDVNAAVACLRDLQRLPDETLLAMQADNRQALDSHFNWDRFAGQVVAAIESPARPPVQPAPLARRLTLRWAALRSPYASWRPGNVARLLVHNWRYRRQRLEERLP